MRGFILAVYDYSSINLPNTFMETKCKLCGKILDTEDANENELGINITGDNELGLNVGEMSKNLLVLINHLITEHPEKALEIYSDLNSKIASIFEVVKTDEFSL